MTIQAIGDDQLLEMLEEFHEEHGLFLNAGNLRGADKILQAWIPAEQEAIARGLINIVED